MKPKALLSWSSGKDSTWSLHVLRQQNEFEIVGLITTFNEAADRVAMHAVRRELVEAQAAAAGLPLWPVMLPWPCSNAEYENRMRRVIDRAKSAGVTRFAFGDLFLEEIRAYRVKQLAGTGIEPMFPIWGTPGDTPKLARTMLDGGMRAVLTCVDPKQLDGEFVGRAFDEALLAELPATVDPCGERGEFHTFCYDGPIFDAPIRVAVGERVNRDEFCFATFGRSYSLTNFVYASHDRSMTALHWTSWVETRFVCFVHRADVGPWSDVEDKLSHLARGQDHCVDALRFGSHLADDYVLDSVELLVLGGRQQAAGVRCLERHHEAEFDIQSVGPHHCRHVTFERTMTGEPS